MLIRAEPDPVLEATGLAGRLDAVRRGPSHETWLLRLLGAALALVVALFVVVTAFAIRIDGRAQRANAALDAAAERDVEATKLAQAQARFAEAVRQLLVATTPAERAAARAELEANPLPPPTTTTTVRRSTGAAARRAPATTTTSARAPTKAPDDPAPSPSTSTPSTSRTTTTTSPPRPCTTRPVLGCLPTDP